MGMQDGERRVDPHAQEEITAPFSVGGAPLQVSGSATQLPRVRRRYSADDVEALSGRWPGRAGARGRAAA